MVKQIQISKKPMHENSLANLKVDGHYRFTKDTAAYYGSIGGKVSSEIKSMSASISSMKHGRYTKNPLLKKLITPTPVEKAMGITHSDKIKELKKFNTFFGSENIIAATEGAEENIGSSEMIFAQWRRELNNPKITNARKESLMNKIFYGGMRIAKAKSEVIDRKFGKDPNIVNQILNLQNTEVKNKITNRELLIAVVGDPEQDEY